MSTFGKISYHYDPIKLKATYDLWSQTRSDDDLEAFIREVLPVFHVTVRRSKYFLDTWIEDVEANFVERLFFFARRGFVMDSRDPRFFVNYLSRVVISVVIDFLRERDMHLHRVNLPDVPHRPRISPLDRLVIREYISGLGRNLYDYILNQVRFNGKEYEACSYIVFHVLQGEDVDPSQVRYLYKIHNAKFLREYCVVLIRLALQKVVADAGEIYVDLNLYRDAVELRPVEVGAEA